MKIFVRFLTVSIVLLMMACQANEGIFLASGYTTENQYDVLLAKVNSDVNISTKANIVIGNNPSYFTGGENGLFYFVNEVDSFNMAAGGGITTVRVDAEAGRIETISQLNQGGGGPCHIVLSDDGKHLITANYGSGSVSVVRLGRDGIPERVTDVIMYGEKSHPHMTLFNYRRGLYYVSDLGLDRIHILKLDTLNGRLINGNVTFIASDPGSGPRHMLIDKKCRNLYVINELASTISIYDIIPETPLLKQTLSTLPAGFTGKNYCADIHFSADRKQIYASNRGDNSIVTFDVGADGTLSSPRHQSCGGNWPRNFAVDPEGKFILVANQRSNMVSVVSAGSTPTGEPVASLPLNAPACLQFMK